MADRRRGRELAECSASATSLNATDAAGQRRRLVHQLLAVRILDPELAQVGADPIDRALKEPLRRSPFPASYTENLIEEEPLFKTKTGK